MKRITAMILVLVLIMGMAGCGAQQPAQDVSVNSEDSAYTFTDDLKREVTVRAPQRVAVLLGSYADVWILAGGGICAAPDDAWEDYDFDLPKETVNLGATKSLSLELLLGCEPDFVIASSNSKQHVEWKETLESAGIPTAYFDVSDFEDYLRMLKICTDITGKKENYEKYGAELESKINEIVKNNADRPEQKVLLLRASAAKVRAKNNHNNVMGEMLEQFNCKNIADSDSTLLDDLNIENIRLEDPEIIFVVEVGDDTDGVRKSIETLFTENPLWQELSAVKNNRVYFMDKHLFNMKPNARWAQAYETLEMILNEEK